MSFLGLPCTCGWALDEQDEGRVRFCVRCNRRWEKPNGYWVQVTPKEQVIWPKVCPHNRLLDGSEECLHCARIVMES